MDYKLIGNKIAILRNIRGYLQKELANLASISVSNLSNIEMGKNKPTLKTIYKICCALDVPIDYIFSDDSEFLFFTMESILSKDNLKIIIDINLFLNDYLKSFIDTNENKPHFNIELPRMVELKNNISLNDESVNSNLKLIIKERLKYYRKLMGITQLQLSELLNKSEHYIAEIENSLKIPSLELFLDICKKMKVPAFCILQCNKISFYYSQYEIYKKIRNYDIQILDKIMSAFIYSNTKRGFER